MHQEKCYFRENRADVLESLNKHCLVNMNAGCNQEERKVRSILYTITHFVTIQCPRVRTDSQLLFSPSKQQVNATLCTRGNLVTSVCGWWVDSSEKTVDAALLFAVAVTSYMYIV